MIALALSASIALTETVEAAELNPWSTFRAACIDGQAKLNKGDAVTVPFSDLPPVVQRAAEAAAAGPGPVLGTDPAVVLSFGTVYRLRTTNETYLLLPLSGKPSSTGCAVVMKGKHYPQARDWILEADGNAKWTPPPRGTPLPFFTIQYGGYTLTAAETRGWTVAVAQSHGATK